MIPSDLIPGLIAVVLGALGILGLWLRRQRGGDTTSTRPRPEVPRLPDTTVATIDDEIAADTAEAVQDAAATHGVSAADIKAALEAADKARK